MMNSVQITNHQDAIGHRIAAHLSGGAQNLSHDISERLKVARLQALSKHKVMRVQTAHQVAAFGQVGTTLNMGVGGRSWWNFIASLLPLLALIVGLLTIAITAEDNRTNEIAEIDAQLLTDDLPPSAYTDPGFAQFLRMNQSE
jgi:hypothetical protein